MRRLTIIAISALVFGFSYLIQPAWENERAHYALVRALAAGKANVDDSMRFPALRSVDVTAFEGHVYSNKAPGLAAATLPPYVALERAGLVTTGNPTRVVWALHLWSVILPVAALLLLVRWRAEHAEPGFGTIAAVSLGIGSLILPFSTVFFAHVLSAMLGFTAFALLARQRETGGSQWLLFLAGLAGGLAFTVEYPLGFVALVLAVLALAGRDRIRRVTLYCLGVAAGALPAFAFNAWAFGTPFHVPQEGWHRVGEEPLPGWFGITRPTLDNALNILFSPGGMGPILLPALVGAVLLWRRNARLEAALPLVITGLFLAFSSGGASPFGGASPGPRYMIATLPFLAVPLAVAFRAFPGATLGLVAGGATFMVAATLTLPLEAWDGDVSHRLITGHWVDSVASFVGLRGSAWDLPFLLALAFAAAAAIAATPWRVVLRRDLLAGVIALGAWLAVSNTLHDLRQHGWAGEATVVAVVAVAALLVAGAYRIRAWPQIPLQPTGSQH
jgi:4-amino-4-deoxy-L-arabinose transferase-like glycosyltransferase